MAINDALPLKATGRDVVAKLKSFGPHGIWAAKKPNVASFRFAVRRHVNAACSVYDSWQWKRILRVGKTDGLF